MASIVNNTYIHQTLLTLARGYTRLIFMPLHYGESINKRSILF